MNAEAQQNEEFEYEIEQDEVETEAEASEKPDVDLEIVDLLHISIDPFRKGIHARKKERPHQEEDEKSDQENGNDGHCPRDFELGQVVQNRKKHKGQEDGEKKWEEDRLGQFENDAGDENDDDQKASCRDFVRFHRCDSIIEHFPYYRKS